MKRMSPTRQVEAALRAERRRMRQTCNHGQDSPQRTEDLKDGRPIAA
jgi:Asp-tRNA(Asn)/Glu-tRNA(Gln) amidotransferase B subunit